MTWLTFYWSAQLYGKRLQVGFRGNVVPSGCELYHWALCRYHSHCPWTYFLPCVNVKNAASPTLYVLTFCKYELFKCRGGEHGGSGYGAADLDQNSRARLRFTLPAATAVNRLDYEDGWFSRKLLWHWKADQIYLGVGGGLTSEPTFSHLLSEPTWKAEGSLLPFPCPRLDSQASLISLASPRPRFFP